jgi:hypothetical protein
MILRMEQQPSIDNLSNYPTDVVDQLGKLLAEGTTGRPDSRRKSFYDIEHADRAFFIYISPSMGKVTLLATWQLLGTSFSSSDEVTPECNTGAESESGSGNR